MKLLRPIAIALAWTISVLMIVQSAAAGGKGGQGGEAAVGIDTILLDNRPNGNVRAEIAGGGFLGGEFLEVTVDGIEIDVDEGYSAELLVATIPASTMDGDHEIMVRTGDDNKQSAVATIRLGGTMTVSCVSWFKTGPAHEHVHTEVHVEDLDGNAVIGATVTWTAENDTNGVYQTNVSLTHDNDGHAGEVPDYCPPVSGSGVTDWFCCIGAGKWDGETPPGKRACDEGEYTARIISVGAPAFTNMLWDGIKVEASIMLEDLKF
ncbi:MAG: hypothetical protein JRG94_19095 [Deltaproteobacteria bacterium]|nr:hypothetical protein [Deltaproteobacteria bacterium]